MGRLKIKKKGVVTPIRQTMAYRVLLVTVSGLFFIYTFVDLWRAYLDNNTLAFIFAAILSVLAGIAIFYNLDRMLVAKIPASTAKRMKRR